MAGHDETNSDLSPEERALDVRLSSLGETTRAEPDSGFEDRLLGAIRSKPIVETKPVTASRRFWARPAALLAPAMAACVAVVVWLSMPGDVEPDKAIALNEAQPADRLADSSVTNSVADLFMEDATETGASTAPRTFAMAPAVSSMEADSAIAADGGVSLSYTEFELFEAELALIEAALIDLEAADPALGFDDGWSM